MRKIQSQWQKVETHDRSIEISLESSQGMAVCATNTYKITLSSLAIPAMHTFCSSNSLVSRVAALVSAIARVTALVPSVARVTTTLATSTLVLLVVVVGGVLLRVTLHLLTVIKVLAFSLDEFVGFATCEAGEEVFGESVIFRDTCGRGRRVSSGVSQCRCRRVV